MSRTSTNAESEQRRTYGRNSRARSKHGRRKKRFPVFLVVLILILLIAGIFVGGEVVRRIMPTTETADLSEVYGVEDGYAPMLIDHVWSESKAVWNQGSAYIPYTIVRDELNAGFYWDSQNHELLYTMPLETVTSDADTQYDGCSVFLEQDGQVYISLTYVTANADVEAEVFTEPEHIVLTTAWGEEQTALVKSDTAVRVKGGIKSPIVTSVVSGDTVTILEVMDNWTQVQTSDGWTGYLQNSTLEESQTTVTEHTSVVPEYTNISVDYEICLVWQQSLFNSAISQLKTLLSSEDAMKSVTTVAPTWFSITAADGTITSNASAEYTALAHQNSLDVWPVLENVNNPDVDMVALLNSTENRSYLVSSVMAALEDSGADGLNVDLENIPGDAADGYIQLIRELSVECRQRGLVLSVDDPAYSAWTSYYNRREQGIVADYVIMMNYDEHYAGSEAGSTASLPYVQDAVAGTLQEVPAEKLINGVPFYTRLWKETPTMESEAIGMDGAASFVAEHNGSAVWDAELGQNYVRIEEGSCTYQLWMEDDASMEARLEMLDSYQLAGIACWKQGMECSSVWNVIAEFYSGR